jgi:hypothetical protein
MTHVNYRYDYDDPLWIQILFIDFTIYNVFQIRSNVTKKILFIVNYIYIFTYLHIYVLPMQVANMTHADFRYDYDDPLFHQAVVILHRNNSRLNIDL